MKRDKQIKFRVTESEYEKIKSIAQDRGLTMTKDFNQDLQNQIEEKQQQSESQGLFK